MSDLFDALTQYLAMRRTLGRVDGHVSPLLHHFVAFVNEAGSPFITTELTRRWAVQPTGAHPSTWSGRLLIARRFAIWRRASDPRTEVPSADLVGQHYRRKPPQRFRDHDIVALVHSAAALPSAKHLRGRTYATLFGLLAVTGLRINEALHLDRSDVDLEVGVLLIRRTKFGKSRLVPIHATTTQALRAYADERDRILTTRPTPAFFLSERATRITEWSARYTFAVISRAIGLRPPTRHAVDYADIGITDTDSRCSDYWCGISRRPIWALACRLWRRTWDTWGWPARNDTCSSRPTWWARSPAATSAGSDI